MPVCNSTTGDMVCVVRGLPDSKLAVTLLEGNKSYTLQIPEENSRRKANDETSRPVLERMLPPKNLKTDAYTTYYKNAQAQHKTLCDTGTQDNRFASSYQVAHCRIKPTVPHEVSEFPPQKRSPSRKDGNFEIRSLISRNTPRSTSSRKLNTFDATFHNSRQSRETTLFVNSLRKYPQHSTSPERSTEILEKLINVTQLKHSKLENQGHNTNMDNLQGKKKSRSPSPRLSPKKELSASSEVVQNIKTLNSNKSSKSIQTYTRSNVPREYKASIEENVNNKNKVIENIDTNQAMDVKYICNMTHNIRERIKEIIEQGIDCMVVDTDGLGRPCPRHRKRCVKRCQRHGQRCIPRVDSATQASGNCCEQACSINHGHNARCLLKKFPMSNQELVITDPKELAAQEEEYNNIIKDWVDTLPLKEDHNNVSYKNDLTNDFADHLRLFAMKPSKCKQLYQQILQDKILDKLKTLPIVSECSDIESLTQYASLLVNRLSNLIINRQSKKPTGEINKKILKDEIINIIENANVTLDKDQINETANKIVDSLSESLEVMRGVNNEATVHNISNLLQHSIPNINSSVANEIGNIISNRAHEISFNQSQNPLQESNVNEVKDTIKSWLETESIKPKDNEAINELTNRLAHIEKHADQPEERRNSEALALINRWLDDNLDIQRNDKPIIAKKLLNQLMAHRYKNVNKENKIGQPSTSNNENNERIYLQELENEINDWLNEIGIDSKSSQLQKNAAKELAGEINERRKYLKNHPNISISEEEENDRLETRIINLLNKVSKTPYDDNNPPPNVDKLFGVIKKLENNINHPKSRDRIMLNTIPSFDSHAENFDMDLDQTVENYDIFTQEIIDWCENLPLPTSNTEEEHQEIEALKLDLMLYIFNKINDLAREENIFNNDTLLRQKLFKQIIKMLDGLPKHPDLAKVKIPMAEQLVEKIIENKHCFRKSSSAEYLNVLKNWVDGIFAFLEDSIPECHVPQLKSDMIQKIHSKAFEYSRDPGILDESRLFQDLICEQIELLIDSLPKVRELQKVKHVQALFIANEIFKNRYLYSEGQNNLEACICKNKPNANLKTTPRKQPLGGYESFRNDIPFNSSLIQPQEQVGRQTIKNLSHIPEESLTGQSIRSMPRDSQFPKGYESFKSEVPISSSMIQPHQFPKGYESFKSEVPMSSSMIQPQAIDRSIRFRQHEAEQIRIRTPSMDGIGVSKIAERESFSSNMNSVRKHPVGRNNLSYQNRQSSVRNDTPNSAGISYSRKGGFQSSGNFNSSNQYAPNISSYPADDQEYYSLESANNTVDNHNQRPASNISKRRSISQRNNSSQQKPFHEESYSGEYNGTRNVTNDSSQRYEPYYSNSLSDRQAGEKEYLTLESAFSTEDDNDRNVSKRQLLSQQKPMRSEQKLKRFNAPGIRNMQNDSLPRSGQHYTNNAPNYNYLQAEEASRAPAAWQSVHPSENHPLAMCPSCHSCDENIGHIGGTRPGMEDPEIDDRMKTKSAIGTNVSNRFKSQTEYESIPELSPDEVQSIKQFIGKIGPKFGLEVQTKNSQMDYTGGSRINDSYYPPHGRTGRTHQHQQPWNTINGVQSQKSQTNYTGGDRSLPLDLRNWAMKSGSRPIQRNPGGNRSVALDLQPRAATSGGQNSRWNMSDAIQHQNSHMGYTGGNRNLSLGNRLLGMNASDGYKSRSEVDYRDNAYSPTRGHSMERLPNQTSDLFNQSRPVQRVTRQQSFNNANDDDMRSELRSLPCDCMDVSNRTCPNCCGTKCPYPSFLYFR